MKQIVYQCALYKSISCGLCPRRLPHVTKRSMTPACVLDKPIRKKTIEESLRNRILYIGNEIPEALANDLRDKFILLGCPQDIIDETKTPSLATALAVYNREKIRLVGK